MDPVTTAIIAALSAGTVAGITDTTKTAISDGYNKLKDLLTKKHGKDSNVVQAIKMLEAMPASTNCQGMVAEVIATAKAEQDDEIMAVAKQILILVKSQQAGMGKFSSLSSGIPPIGIESNHQYAEQLLNRLKKWETNSNERISTQHQVSATSGQFVATPAEIEAILPPGVTQLYTHQLQAFEMANRGEPLTIATATASGKTYAMALPARLKRQRYPNATLLCVAPTRALIEQWKERLLSWDPTVCVETYTGDTPKDQKHAIRARAQYIITTPDTLHMGILPYHHGWSRFFMHLQDVIIDESHLYYGVFGSHFSLILRRLQRVAGIYRPELPSFFFGSATIGNPDDHATHLLGQSVSAITESGAPSGGRLTLLWQPPDGRKHNQESAYLMSFFVQQGIRCILFGQARQSVEKMLRQVKDLIPQEDQGKVMAYRAGYSKEDRRLIERRLASGELLGVISTSALEVGIDLGDIDVSIMSGFPGGISSYKQQAGRAGRRNRSALSILVLRDDATRPILCPTPTGAPRCASRKSAHQYQQPLYPSSSLTLRCSRKAPEKNRSTFVRSSSLLNN